MVLSAESTQRLLISSDERNDWFFEDHNFVQTITNNFRSCVKKGVSSTHIYTSNQDLDIVLYSVRQSISGYMLGNLRQYYYPMHRDKLYRRTLMIMPGVAALHSSSLSNQLGSYMTTLTTVEDVVECYRKEFYDLFSFCKPITTVYTPETEEKLFSRMKQIQAKSAESIFKVSSLPAHSLPKSIMEKICKLVDTPLANKAYENHLNAAQSRAKSMQKYNTIDIIKLAPIEKIREGKVEIPASNFFSYYRYYTPDDYKQHLQCIVDDLKLNQNYNVIISESSDLDSLVLYGIGTDTAMIIKQSNPYTVIEINEANFACSFIEFLQSFAEKEQKNRSKQETISILERYINQI